MRWSFLVQDILTLACCALCLLLVNACATESALPPILDLELTDAADPADGGDSGGTADDAPDDATADADPGSGDDAEDPGSDALGDSGSDADIVNPANDYCAATEPWEEDWALFEQDVLERVNARRSQGAVCGDTPFDPASPLTENGALRCAARAHAEDMALRDFFAHTNPDGEGPGERIARTEYQHRTWGENIAFGYASPESVVEGWMNSPGHCSNIMNPAFTEIGVGYYEGNQWVQVFGAPR